MKLLRTKMWSWLDIGLLKWSCILLGMVAGVYLADVLRPYVMVLLVLAILCAVKPAVDYLGNDYLKAIVEARCVTDG